MVERGFGTDQCRHAADTWRKIRFLNIQSGIGGTLPVVAVRAEIPGAQQLDLAYGGQHASCAHLPVTGFVAAGTRHLALIRAGRAASQQPAQRGRPGSMHGSPHRHLDRFQVESASLALVLKNKPQQRAYFPFDFLPDRFGRFFS
jgi:hypothetical protein